MKQLPALATAAVTVGVLFAGSNAFAAAVAPPFPAQAVVFTPIKIDRMDPTMAKLTARYVCVGTGAAHLWVSVKQAAGGAHDPRLPTQGSSQFANAWSQTHPTDFVCDGEFHTQTFTLDQTEQGFGTLTPGLAWVQFCMTGIAGPPIFYQHRGVLGH